MCVVYVSETVGSRYGDPAEFKKLIIPLGISAVIFFLLLGLLLFFYIKYLMKKMNCCCKCVHHKSQLHEENVKFDPSLGIVNSALSADDFPESSKNTNYIGIKPDLEETAEDTTDSEENVKINIESSVNKINPAFSTDAVAVNRKKADHTEQFADKEGTDTKSAEVNLEPSIGCDNSAFSTNDVAEHVQNADNFEQTADLEGYGTDAKRCPITFDCLKCQCTACTCGRNMEQLTESADLEQSGTCAKQCQIVCDCLECKCKFCVCKTFPTENGP